MKFGKKQFLIAQVKGNIRNPTFFFAIINLFAVGKLTATYVDVWGQQFSNGIVKFVPISSLSFRYDSHEWTNYLHTSKFLPVYSNFRNKYAIEKCKEAIFSGFCKLNKDPSIKYRCLTKGNDSDVVGERDCNDQEPIGTSVKPICNTPHYYSTSLLPNMKCYEDGNWDYVATCLPECGRTTPTGSELVIDGMAPKRGVLPWHVGIYQKTTMPYRLICGGSIVRNNVVLTAAHCFWNDVEEKLPAANYAVAAGKLYRPWNDPMDYDVQKSDVKEINIPVRFQGNSANYQDDIALLTLTSPFEYRTYVRPVCMDFDVIFERAHLKDGNLGKVTAMGVTGTNKPSAVLQSITLPYIDIEKCIANVPPHFREYITSDKFCAGYQNVTTLCKGDSGGGLAFPESNRGTILYYLRGIALFGPAEGGVCSPTYTTFTQISKHEHFIKEFL